MRSSSKKVDADVARHELIGLEVRVEAPGTAFDGIEGRVVDETRHTLLVEQSSGSEARVPKRGLRFLFRVGDASARIEGDNIAFRPEERTKKSRG